MPGPIDKSVATITLTAPLPDETVAGDPPKSDPPPAETAAAEISPPVQPPIPTSESSAISQLVDGSISMPSIVFKHPRVAGETIVDRGEDAEFLVIHRRFGEFTEGSRISFEDIDSPADLPSFLKLGAIVALGEDGQILSPEAVAERLKDWKPPKAEPASSRKRGR
ncbi:hypothetical protein V5E97_06765 [Singulisphaera sp. Ch08]|uniref:Uncharacterized protein n=1 Tax=Singulisphaera sp. Ch08 TaxID=3120278 RepID=A0AAU7CL13_9BACT